MEEDLDTFHKSLMAEVENQMEAQESNKKQNLKSNGKILLTKMEMSYKKHNKASKLNKVQKFDAEHNIIKKNYRKENS